MKWFKMRESLNLGYMALDLRDWVGLVVIGRRGCGMVEQMRLIILDIEYELRWYFRVKRVEVIFLKK